MPPNAATKEKKGAAQAKNEAPKNGGENLAAISLNFTKKVERQFTAELGQIVVWTDHQRRLAQHLFIKTDQTIKQLNLKRAANDQITWDRINMEKLAIDAVHRVSLGLDALIKNHIHPIPYMNGKSGKFDLDLRIGYVGVDFCHREHAVDPPADVVYKLVYESEKFVPHFKDRNNEIESYTLSPSDNPFNPGKVVGGFGYIVHDDPRKNRLIVVTERDFKRAQAAAQTQDFWAEAKSADEMKYKTIVHRTCAKIPLDPMKVNAGSMQAIDESRAEAIIAEADALEQRNGNAESLDFRQADAVPAAPATTPIEQAEPIIEGMIVPPLTDQQIIDALGLNVDQADFVRDQLADSNKDGNPSAAEFLRECHEVGDRTFDDVNKRLKALLATAAALPF